MTRDRIVPTALEGELRRSYLAYALSVLVGRALPDGRDGLKPVQRRILYALWQMGLTAQRPHRKSARIVGEVLGKYHPHGDQAVYGALVRLAQDFHCRYPLIDGQGNFGSLDNDPAAAMRYTEARLSAFAEQVLFRDLHPATVDFRENFDGSETEPQVLPAQLPLLLLNGCSGIAVGMATQIPPHHAGEVIEALLQLIDYPHLSDERLYYCIPAPDFPTGGEVVDPQAIRRVYRTGKGAITLRGTWRRETQGRGKRARETLVITALPYGVAKADWIQRTAELLHQGRLEGIADLRDESDREGLRIVLTVKPGYDPEQVVQQLYAQTPLQTQFHASFLALLDGRPQQCSLRRWLQQFLQFREQTLQRLYRYQHQQVSHDIQRLTALQRAMTHLAVVFQVLQDAPNLDQARQQLMQQLGLTADQAEMILSTPLKRLTRLEAQALETQLRQLQQEQQRLAHLQQDRQARLQELKRQLRQLQRQWGREPRRTRIVVPETPPPEPLTLRLRASGRWQRLDEGSARQLSLDLSATTDDPLLWQGTLHPQQRLLLFGRSGGVQVFTVQDFVGGEPGQDWRAEVDWDGGLPPLLISPETVAVWLVSRGGYGTVMATGDLWQGTWGFPADDALLAVGIWQEQQTLWLVSNQGRFWSCPLPRRSHGRRLVRLTPNEMLVGAVPADSSGPIHIVTASGVLQPLHPQPPPPSTDPWVSLVQGSDPFYGYTDRHRWVRLDTQPLVGETLLRVVPRAGA
ncbi:MAG: DNA gyrase subunit A [Gloeomargarita sp. GMQP_bins_120]